jgi:hypothetical protein
MAQMQTGPCAFSNACVTPGPRVRIEGTNRSCCAPHAALLQITVATGLGAEMEGHPRQGLMVKTGKKRAGRLLDGREWNEYPEVHA